MGIISSKQFLKLITNYLSYLFSFVLNYHFFENCPKIENHLLCISVNSSSRMCILIWNSSSFSLSGLPFFSQMNKPYSLSNPELKIFLYAFFSIFYKSNNKKLTIIFSSCWYLILIPTVIMLVPELITLQQDYFNYFLADLSWSCFWPLQYFFINYCFLCSVHLFYSKIPQDYFITNKNKFKIS